MEISKIGQKKAAEAAFLNKLIKKSGDGERLGFSIDFLTVNYHKGIE